MPKSHFRRWISQACMPPPSSVCVSSYSLGMGMHSEKKKMPWSHTSTVQCYPTHWCAIYTGLVTNPKHGIIWASGKKISIIPERPDGYTTAENIYILNQSTKALFVLVATSTSGHPEVNQVIAVTLSTHAAHIQASSTAKQIGETVKHLSHQLSHTNSKLINVHFDAVLCTRNKCYWDKLKIKSKKKTIPDHRKAGEENIVLISACWRWKGNNVIKETQPVPSHTELEQKWCSSQVWFGICFFIYSLLKRA